MGIGAFLEDGDFLTNPLIKMSVHFAGKLKVILQRNPKIAQETCDSVRISSDFTGDPFGRGIRNDSVHVL